MATTNAGFGFIAGVDKHPSQWAARGHGNARQGRCEEAAMDELALAASRLDSVLIGYDLATVASK